ncbi:MAG: hypothetical protein ACRDY7_01075 [Acidimicrobiia bacterium]
MRNRTRTATLLCAAGMLATLAVPGVTGADPITGQPHPADAFAFSCWQYVPSTVTITQGETFKFGNYDMCPGGAGIAGHSLDEVVPGCTAPPYTKNNAGENGKCTYPRFTSGLVDHGHVHEVAGAADLQKGTYEFTCQVHSFMRGTLVVE